jgi:choline dehydrogenase-like flavoprotein
VSAANVEPAAAYDYIVCGAGTAGCLLANRLSADRTKHVLLIEAGGNDDYLWIHIPVGYLYCIGNPRTDWLYATEPAAGLNGRSLRYPRGKVLGGCSSINGMIYMRGQARDYDGWGAGDGFGANPGWSWDECLPYFLKHEDFHKGRRRLPRRARVRSEGQTPRRRVAGGKAAAALGRARRLRRGAREAGIPHTDDFNRGDNEGVGYFEVNQRAGIRWNATKAFLRPIERRPNLQVWTGAHIDRIELDGDGRRAACASRRSAAARPKRRRSLRRRGHPRHRRDRHAADPAALRHRPGAAAAGATASPSGASSPAWARTSRTTCRSAPSSASRGCRPSTAWPTRSGARRRSPCTTPGSAAGR